jgi:hypothetical protein
MLHRQLGQNGGESRTADLVTYFRWRTCMVESDAKTHRTPKASRKRPFRAQRFESAAPPRAALKRTDEIRRSNSLVSICVNLCFISGEK